jgi:serine/threonine-protein kinase
MSPEFPDDSHGLKKFAQVIKAIGAATKHPNLVHWRGAGKSGPYVWIAQDLIDGENLKSSFSQPESSRWSWRGAWRLAWEIGQALDHLHRQHVAHGNITDANLLIAESGKAMLNDLRFKEAIAGSSLQRRIHKQKLEAELPFCPPERLEEGQFVDEYVADIYSLGVAAYVRLSCGMYPFQGATTSETTNLILNGVSDKHRRRAPAAPDEFLDVLYKMLARTQEDRYQNTAALLADLERFKNVK